MRSLRVGNDLVTEEQQQNPGRGQLERWHSKKSQTTVVGIEDRVQGHKSRNGCGFWKLEIEKSRNWFFLRAYKGIKPCKHFEFLSLVWAKWASQLVLVVKSWPANAGDLRDAGLIPGSGRFPGGGNGKLLQYSCLKNPMEKGVWQATVWVGHDWATKHTHNELNNVAGSVK